MKYAKLSRMNLNQHASKPHRVKNNTGSEDMRRPDGRRGPEL